MRTLNLQYIWAFALLVIATTVAPVDVSAADPLTRVLIVGDSIYNTPTRSAATMLKGRVEVVWNKFSSADSGTVLKNMDELLGDKKWALIHFNFGLNDLMYKDPGTKAIRAMAKEAGGVRVSSPQQYENKLRELVKQFKATGAKLIWASTTPIKTNYNGVLDADSEIEYNKIAAKVMKENKVPINDMHAYVIANIKKSRNNSPYWFNRQPLHPPMVTLILRELNLK